MPIIYPLKQEKFCTFFLKSADLAKANSENIYGGITPLLQYVDVHWNTLSFT